jgi:hypothetical protein
MVVPPLALMMDIDQVSEMHLVSLKKILVYSFTVKA